MDFWLRAAGFVDAFYRGRGEDADGDILRDGRLAGSSAGGADGGGVMSGCGGKGEWVVVFGVGVGAVILGIDA